MNQCTAAIHALKTNAAPQADQEHGLDRTRSTPVQPAVAAPDWRETALAILRRDCQLDEHGDSFCGVDPMSGWETGYCAGQKSAYCALKDADPPADEGHEKQHVDTGQPALSASPTVETRACYRSCKGPGSEGCEHPKCLSGSASRCVAVPPSVRLSLMTLLNHVEPGWDNCKALVEMWLRESERNGE